MNILTVDNIPFDLNDLPNELEEDLRFSVLDNSNPEEPDFYFMPLIFLESFNSPAALLDINGYTVQMPLDWCLVVGDQDSGVDPEVLPLTALNERGFDALVVNPVCGFRVEYQPVKIINIFQEVKWYFPKMKPGQLLSVPLSNEEEPVCAFFTKEINRQSEVIQLHKLL